MSFDIALSGIQAINQQLDTISNNIANAGTLGFKSSRSNFAALYAGTQKTGTEIGSETQSLDLGGGILNTGSGLNASINGAGFFVSKDAQNQTTYSRVGIFKADNSGLVVDQNGNAVQGFAAVKQADGSLKPGAVGNLTVSIAPMPAVASTTLDYVGNMSADWTTIDPTAVPFDPAVPASYNDQRTSTVFDSLGVQHSVTAYFTKTGADQVTVNYMVDGNTDPTINPQSAVLDFDGSTGQLSAVNTVAVGTTAPTVPVTIDTTASGANTGGAAPAPTLTVAFDYSGTTLFAGKVSTATNQDNGNGFGAYTGQLTLGADGSLTAQYANNKTQVVGYVAVATFADQDALQAISGTSWVATSGSGTANVDVPGAGRNALLSTGTLEQSNVDVTEQLVGLMTAQRNYQANSKVITTEDNTLQALMQAIQ
jgi:flagellar hook protein FlgE